MTNILRQILDVVAPQNEEFLNQGRDTQPSAAAPTGLTSGNQTWGSWGEIEDSLAADSFVTHVQIIATHVTVDEVITVQIGTGTAGSESGKTTFIIEVQTQNISITVPLPHPIFIPAATRVAGRCVGTTTNAITVSVKVQFQTGISNNLSGKGGRDGILIGAMANALFDIQQQGTYSTLPIPDATTGIVTPVAITAGNAYANGTYGVIHASNPADCIVDMIVITESATVTTYFEVDIAIGVDESEVVYRTIPVKNIDVNEIVIIVLPFPLYVPSGERLAARARGSAATAFDIVAYRRLGFKLN